MPVGRPTNNRALPQVKGGRVPKRPTRDEWDELMEDDMRHPVGDDEEEDDPPR